MKRTRTNRNMLLVAAGILAAMSFTMAPRAQAEADTRPNILWIFVEDMSPFMRLYGFEENPTPAIEALAANGVTFKKCYVNAPVCSSMRSGLVLGAMQTTLGVHNHRSEARRGYPVAELPEGVKPVSLFFQDAGYFTFNDGKDDFNFTYDRKQLWPGSTTGRFYKSGDQFSWRKREKGQPFFGWIQLAGGKNNPKRQPKHPIDRDAAAKTLPPYYPKTKTHIEEWAWHHDCNRVADENVAEIMAALKEDGLIDNTIVIFFTDHGLRLLRHKQFCYEGGTHVPLIISWPGRKELVMPGHVRDDLVTTIDLTVTSLALAGIDVPDYMEGRNLFAPDHQPRKFVISARDRCDYTIDRIRTVRTDRYRYIRNFMTDRPWMQPQYRDGRAITVEMKQMYADGKLTPAQARFMQPERPGEELYDHKNDPHEINNLADDPAYKEVLAQHRQILEDWIEDTDDKGQYPETKEQLRVVMSRWGKRCVNPEYDAIKKEQQDAAGKPAR